MNVPWRAVLGTWPCRCPAWSAWWPWSGWCSAEWWESALNREHIHLVVLVHWFDDFVNLRFARLPRLLRLHKRLLSVSNNILLNTRQSDACCACCGWILFHNSNIKTLLLSRCCRWGCQLHASHTDVARLRFLLPIMVFGRCSLRHSSISTISGPSSCSCTRVRINIGARHQAEYQCDGGKYEPYWNQMSWINMNDKLGDAVTRRHIRGWCCGCRRWSGPRSERGARRPIKFHSRQSSPRARATCRPTGWGRGCTTSQSAHCRHRIGGCAAVFDMYACDAWHSSFTPPSTSW